MKLTPLADRVILKMLEVDDHDVVMTVKPGDKVITSKYSGTEVKVDDEEYTVVRQSDILAIVE